MAVSSASGSATTPATTPVTTIPASSAPSSNSTAIINLLKQFGIKKEDAEKFVNGVTQFCTHFDPEKSPEAIDDLIKKVEPELKKLGVNIEPEKIKTDFNAFIKSISDNFSVDKMTDLLASKQGDNFAKIGAWVKEKIPILYPFVEVASKFELLRSTASINAIANFVVHNPFLVLTSIGGIILTGVITPPSLGFAALLLVAFLGDYANQAGRTLNISDAQFKLNDVATRFGTDPTTIAETRAALVKDIDNVCSKSSENKEDLKLALYAFVELSLLDGESNPKLPAHLAQLSAFVSNLHDKDKFFELVKTLPTDSSLTQATKTAFETANQKFELPGNQEIYDQQLKTQKSITDKILSFLGFGGADGKTALSKTFAPALAKADQGWRAVVMEAIKNYARHLFESQHDAAELVGSLKARLPSQAQFEKTITKAYNANDVSSGTDHPASSLKITASLFDQLVVKDVSLEVKDPKQKLVSIIDLINKSDPHNKKRVAEALKRMAEAISSQGDKMPQELIDFAEKIKKTTSENKTDEIIKSAEILVKKLSEEPLQS